MTWRCAGLFALPVAFVYLLSFCLPAWEDANSVYFGYETLQKSFDVAARNGDLVTPMLVLLPNLIVCSGLLLLAVPKTWARIVAAVLGFVALLFSVQIMICVGFLSVLTNIATAMFGQPVGPSGVREGFFVWVVSMFMLMLMGLITAIVSGTNSGPDRRDDDNPFRRYDDDDDSDRRRPRYDDNDDEPFNRRRRSEGERYRRDPD